MNEQSDLDLAVEAGAEWLEERGGFARYMTGVDEDGDGVSQWYCTSCGAMTDGPDELCEICGEDE